MNPKIIVPICLLLPLLVCFSGASDLSDRLAPDMVLHNGKIVTVDAKFSLAEAVAIKDGRLIAVGSNREVKRLRQPADRW